jgi:hypothetical protein
MPSRRQFLVTAAAAAALPCPAAAAELVLPAWRVAADGWGSASAADVKTVLESVIRELWRHFPGRKLEPFVVQRGHDGPIVHYRRNAMKEIVVMLDTGDLYWSQYVYQFAHEFCHILCGFDDDWKGNLWFEESLCETASLFALRRLAEVWAKKAPYENWRSYAPRFNEYAQDVMDRRVNLPDSRMAGFYQRHRAELEKNPVDRELNGTVSLFLLRQIETAPSLWESLTWLNSAPSVQGESFPAYLQKWRNAAPAHCRGFIETIALKLGQKLPPAEQAR